ncbi:SH3 and cysteine-rich domain-containing protein isoform X2 [Danio rerio]|uniref:SH3 and cysteine-rich domain-containing protein isoform X2 n=1 Tax=Danio rerio TaxID=7955 RepID=A0A8M3AJV3_DANRE|nr:SH3 and cysteine-rich domain-containing protein isoform X2 [Danio rerio]|eukprot:XP_009291344.1 SH3 and cysteine-rich domain-containing protein isoform X2 [Danio rerio]
MIPPANMIQEDTMGKENERDHREPQSPSSISQQESKLQRLKRSLSFKTKSLRSKSADNFFQRPIEDVKFQTELLSDVSSSTGHLSSIGVSVTASPAMSLPPPPPPLPTVIPGNLPITICSPSRAPRQTDPNAHTFLEHIFKKPHFCDICNHMIVGTNAKLGLRCKACKMGIHHKCLDGVGQQRCMGKLPKGFRRYSSSPLLIQEQFGCIREVMPIACGSKVDPVYETLRFGTSLAQKNKRTSGSESPQRNSTSDVAQVPEEKAAHCSRAQLIRKPSDNVFMPLENGTEHFHVAERKAEESLSERELKRDPLLLNTYVALFGFTAQDNQDLEMRPGDRIVLADDSNDDWWKGVIEDRIGFFPAAFAHQVTSSDRVFRCNRTFIGCKEQGQITLKEGQICVSGENEHNGFIRVASGKKRGYVPCDVLENI